MRRDEMSKRAAQYAINLAEGRMTAVATKKNLIEHMRALCGSRQSAESKFIKGIVDLGVA